MPDETSYATAVHALENAIDAFMTVMRDTNTDCDDVVAVDAALLVGVQWYDHTGGRCGNVMVLPRHGSQPYYTTIGLLDGARQDVLTSKADH
jgi:hypothetical protein